MTIFDLLAYLCGLLGWFDPQQYNLQYFVYLVARLFGYSINVPLG